MNLFPSESVMALYVLIQQTEEKNGDGMTVREFIECHPNATMDMMTPGGYVTITPEIATSLLRGEDVASHPGANEHWAKVTAEELLPQEINQCREHPENPNYFYMLTEYVQEHQQEQGTSAMVALSQQSM